MSDLKKCHDECLDIITAFRGNRSSNSLKKILSKYIKHDKNDDIPDSEYSRGSW